MAEEKYESANPPTHNIGLFNVISHGSLMPCCTALHHHHISHKAAYREPLEGG
jgi:hypothetical protein